MTAHFYRPEPVLAHAAAPIDRSTAIAGAALRLAQGEQLIVRDHYRTGVLVLAELERQLGPPGPGAPFAERQAASVQYREAALRLLAPVEGHRAALEEGGPSGFLAELYPELRSFALPFIEVQSLHGAWDRYTTGTHLAVLGHKLHPFYGTYAPTRVSHLELFGTWLSQYEGPRLRALDVGTGSGVLALMLARAGFGHIVATDSNPNAIESVTRELRRLSAAPSIELIHGDLLGPGTSEEELVVFNPPWIQGTVTSQLDSALYFEPSLFGRFFDQALARLAPEGRIALVFSNVMSLLQSDVPHPIEVELARGRLRLVSKLRRKVKPLPDKSGRRRRTKERVEVWELARA